MGVTLISEFIELELPPLMAMARLLHSGEFSPTLHSISYCPAMILGVMRPTLVTPAALPISITSAT
jgi:hypothetical protein